MVLTLYCDKGEKTLCFELFTAVGTCFRLKLDRPDTVVQKRKHNGEKSWLHAVNPIIYLNLNLTMGKIILKSNLQNLAFK